MPTTPTPTDDAPKQDPFQLTVYQLALHTAGQLTTDELRSTLKDTVPEMKAALEPPPEPEEPAPTASQY